MITGTQPERRRVAVEYLHQSKGQLCIVVDESEEAIRNATGKIDEIDRALIKLPPTNARFNAGSTQ